MKNARRGTDAELEVAKKLRREGFTVVRSARSGGPWDLVAVRAIPGSDPYPVAEVRLIQVKRLRVPRPAVLRNAARELLLVAPPRRATIRSELWSRVDGPVDAWKVSVIA